MKRKAAFCGFLAVGMTVVATCDLSAQAIDRGMMTKISESSAILPWVGMLGEFKKKSLVGSWTEIVTFVGAQAGRVSTGIGSYHEDGTELGTGIGAVVFDAPPKNPKDPQTGTVTSDGVGVWAQLDWHRYVVTELDLFSDFSGNLTGSLKVRGILRLDSPDKYTGYSFYEGFDTAGNLLFSGYTTNKGTRTRVELPPPMP
jgi:hypothetical protein